MLNTADTIELTPNVRAHILVNNAGVDIFKIKMNSRNEYASIKNIEEIEEKMKNVALDNKFNDDVSNFDQEHSTLSQNNYYYDSPHHLNSSNHLFDIHFVRSIQGLRSQEKRCYYFKNGTRISYTFSNEQIRRIERENQILLSKILAQRPQSSSISTNSPNSLTSSASRISSAAINRRHQQERINIANDILRKKIEKILQRKRK
ncbi:protein hemingway [Sitodiplosis mosellana]|uniref:protein hemingway n=1 Tax=Sitodiplosis mosellana TaxID=263140 RepID=UPI002444E7B4|nr:protein hemingway [Sitodiplosis mosellana]